MIWADQDSPNWNCKCSRRSGKRGLLRSRNPGYFSGAKPAGLHYRPDGRLSPGSKKALRCVKRISNANIFEAVVSRKDAERRLVDELLGLFGGRAKMVMAHLVESGELTLEDVKEAEKALRKSSGKDRQR